MSEHDFDVVVIGGGQAGLAMGYYLREQGLRFAIVERGDSIAPAWRERWGLPDAFHAAPLQRAAGPTWPASSVQCGPAAQ
jgi:putative flavoprotein involved in K+ transport